MSQSRKAINEYQELIKQYNDLQEKRKDARMTINTMFIRTIDPQLIQQATQVEEVFNKKLAELNKKLSQLMLEALKETTAEEYSKKALTVLAEGSYIAVKKISNPIQGVLIDNFKKYVPFKLNDYRGPVPTIDIGNRQVVFDPKEHRVVFRPRDVKQITIKEHNIFVRKSSYTLIAIPTANVSLFHSKDFKTPFCLIIDPKDCYLSTRFTFPYNEQTDYRWWIGNTFAFEDLFGYGITNRLKMPVSTTTLEELQAYQSQELKDNEGLIQNEIMPKITLKSILGVMVPKPNKDETETDILINRLATLCANFTWRSYVFTQYPQFVHLWQVFPTYLHQPLEGKVDFKNIYDENKLGIVPYTLENQIKDVYKARESDNENLKKWVVKLESIARSCPKDLIPEELIKTFDKIQQDIFQKLYNSPKP